MGVASNQARLFLLTSRKSDLELAMSNISMRQQLLATKQAEAVAKKTSAMTQFLNSEKDSSVTFEQTAAYAEYEKAMTEIEIADNNLNMQLKAMETEHQVVSQELEETRKLVDNNVKNSFAPFK